MPSKSKKAAKLGANLTNSNTNTGENNQSLNPNNGSETKFIGSSASEKSDDGGTGKKRKKRSNTDQTNNTEENSPEKNNINIVEESKKINKNEQEDTKEEYFNQKKGIENLLNLLTHKKNKDEHFNMKPIKSERLEDINLKHPMIEERIKSERLENINLKHPVVERKQSNASEDFKTNDPINLNAVDPLAPSKNVKKGFRMANKKLTKVDAPSGTITSGVSPVKDDGSNVGASSSAVLNSEPSSPGIENEGDGIKSTEQQKNASRQASPIRPADAQPGRDPTTPPAPAPGEALADGRVVVSKEPSPRLQQIPRMVPTTSHYQGSLLDRKFERIPLLPYDDEEKEATFEEFVLGPVKLDSPRYISSQNQKSAAYRKQPPPQGVVPKAITHQSIPLQQQVNRRIPGTNSVNPKMIGGPSGNSPMNKAPVIGKQQLTPQQMAAMQQNIVMMANQQMMALQNAQNPQMMQASQQQMKGQQVPNMKGQQIFVNQAGQVINQAQAMQQAQMNQAAMQAMFMQQAQAAAAGQNPQFAANPAMIMLQNMQNMQRQMQHPKSMPQQQMPAGSSERQSPQPGGKKSQNAKKKTSTNTPTIPQPEGKSTQYQ